MVSNEVGCRVPSTAQAGSSFNMDTFEEHIRQFASLPSFLESCSISDPAGLYVLNMKPLQYNVKGLQKSPNNLMFDTSRSSFLPLADTFSTIVTKFASLMGPTCTQNGMVYY